MTKKISVLLVDDSEVVRLGLRSLLAMYPDMEVVGEAAHANVAIQLAMEKKPNVILMDIRLPCRSGIEACKEITKVCPECAVIMLTSYNDEETIYESILAGAQGYVLKDIAARELMHAIEQVAAGQSLLDPAITFKLFKRIRGAEDKNKMQVLTPQERQVIVLIARGKTNREIAQAMILSEKTVRNYVTQILAKLELNNRAEAAAFAVRHQLD